MRDQRARAFGTAEYSATGQDTQGALWNQGSLVGNVHGRFPERKPALAGGPMMPTHVADPPSRKL
jgi:hypothetical protein